MSTGQFEKFPKTTQTQLHDQNNTQESRSPRGEQKQPVSTIPPRGPSNTPWRHLYDDDPCQKQSRQKFFFLQRVALRAAPTKKSQITVSEQCGSQWDLLDIADCVPTSFKLPPDWTLSFQSVFFFFPFLFCTTFPLQHTPNYIMLSITSRLTRIGAGAT